MQANFDIIIIGNSILGLSTAFALLQRDPKLKIAIVGPYNKIGSASMASGAMIGCFGEITSCTFSNSYNKTKFDISYEALSMWPEWLEQINIQDKNSLSVQFEKGTHIILNSKSGQLDCDTYNEIEKGLKQYGKSYQEINPLDIPGLKPVEDARPLKAMYIPEEGKINPILLIQKLESILKTYQYVQFIDDMVENITVRNSQIESVILQSGTILYTENTLLAAGSFCQKIINKIADLQNHIPLILAGAGYSIILATDPACNISHVLRTPNRAGACGLHAFSQDKDTLYIGASNNLFLDPQRNPNIGLIHFILECAMEQINENLHRYNLINWQVGNRPVTIDTFPLIGPTSIEGLYILTGTYREGLHQSPLLATYMADIILNKRSSLNLDIEVFLPERKPIKTFNILESITEGIKHYMSGAYERGMKLPKAGWDPLLRELFHKRLTELYDQLDLDFGLSPDMLMMIEFSTNKAELINLFKKYLH